MRTKLSQFLPLVGILSLLPTVAHAQPNGVTFTISNIGTYPCNMTPGTNGQVMTVDFNGDGLMDYSAPGGNSGGINLLQRKATGGFDFLNLSLVTPPLPFGAYVIPVFWNDFNGDGKPDLLVRRVSFFSLPDVQYYLFCNDGNGALVYTNTLTLATNEVVTDNHDFDGDGISDLVIQNTTSLSTSNSIFNFYLSRGTTNGIFSTRASLFQAAGFYTGDFDGNGTSDFAALTTDSKKLTVNLFTNNGNGTFKNNGGIKLAPFSLSGAADLTGDGKCDLFGAYGTLLRTDNLRQMTAFNYWPTYPDLQIGGPIRQYIGDFNGDGRRDLLTTGKDSRLGWGYTLYTGTATGTLSTYSNLVNLGDYNLNPGATLSPNAFAFALDYDGDGKTDLVRFTYDAITQTTQVDVLISGTT